jgi:hypothetical protein
VNFQGCHYLPNLKSRSQPTQLSPLTLTLGSARAEACSLAITPPQRFQNDAFMLGRDGLVAPIAVRRGGRWQKAGRFLCELFPDRRHHYR